MESNSETGSSEQQRVEGRTRKILWWGTETWSRIIALMSMMQHSVSLFIVVHEIILMFNGGMENFSWKFLSFLIIGLIVCCIGIFTGLLLLLGVDLKFASYMNAWVVSTCTVTGTILISAIICVSSGEGSRNAWIVLPGVVLLCLVHLPCIWLVNVHRKEVDKEKILQMIKAEVGRPRSLQERCSLDGAPVQAIATPRPGGSYVRAEVPMDVGLKPAFTQDRPGEEKKGEPKPHSSNGPRPTEVKTVDKPEPHYSNVPRY